MSNLPSLLGSAGVAASPSRRDSARVERAVSRDIALVYGRAQVLQARGRANTRVVEDIAIDAMESGTHVTRVAAQLATSCPAAEPMLREIWATAGLALGRIVSDTGRDLR